MTHSMRRFGQWILIVATSLTLAACSFNKEKEIDNIAYQNANSLKVESLALIQKATEPYAMHEEEIIELTKAIDKAYEYAKGKPNNEVIAEQWAKIRDPERNMMGGFLARWKSNGQFTQEFIDFERPNVTAGFDQVIGLESGLIVPEKD